MRRLTPTEGSNPSFSASDFFQYFNPSNACLQAVDLIEFFLLKLSPILKKVTLSKGGRTVETAFCSKPLDLASSKPEFLPYQFLAVFIDSAHQKILQFLRCGKHYKRRSWLDEFLSLWPRQNRVEL